MRLVRVLAVLLVVACGSSSGLQKNLIEGGPGQPVTVDISWVEGSIEIPDRDNSRSYTVQVEVGNSSDALVTVTQISIRTDSSNAFQVYPTVQRFNELIGPEKDHLFGVVVRGRFARPFAQGEAHSVVLRVIVTLSDGDSYAYAFEGPVRETP